MRALASFDDRDPVPWANGAGQTTELVSLPDSAQLTPGLRPWRLSIARLERVGPFSARPGMARTHRKSSLGAGTPRVELQAGKPLDASTATLPPAGLRLADVWLWGVAPACRLASGLNVA